MTISGRCLRSVCVAALVVFAAGCGMEDEGRDRSERDGAAVVTTADVDSIRSVLEAQVASWNAGSIRGFMEGYAQSDTLRFASGGNVWRGWDVTRVRYEDTYADEGLMGTLAFSDEEIWPLSPRYALVFGRWSLTRSESYANIGGLYTLLFEKTENGWRIVHDHTSAAETIESPPDTSETTP